VQFLLKELEDIEPTDADPNGKMTWGRCWGCEKGVELCPTGRKSQRYIYSQEPFFVHLSGNTSCCWDRVNILV
jgi:hypothetical protein